MSELKMQFDPSTIEHLGIQMYSRLPNALAELIANAYDADADSVHIKLYDSGIKRIEVIDDGIGMSFDEVNDKFLRIGRHRRQFEEGRKTLKGRVITGRKGLGKLALFGIGKNIEIITKIKGAENELVFNLNWENITNCKTSEYKPPFSVEKKESSQSGTTLILSDLDRRSPFDIENTAKSLSKLINLTDENFRVFISLNDGDTIEITKELKYASIEHEFEWDISDIANELDSVFVRKNELKGKIFATPKPAPSSIRGITLYVNGRMANESGFFGSADSSHVYSYLTGWVEADYIDEFDIDIISTDRQSLNWEVEHAEELQQYLISMLRFLEKKWRKSRADKNKKEAAEKTKIDIDTWTNTMSESLGQKVKNAVENIIEEESIGADVASKIVSSVHDIAPEYADFHFRELHADLQNAAYENYKDKKYYYAFVEAAKRYINKVAIKAGVPDDGEKLMTKVFGGNCILDVVQKYVNNPKNIILRDMTLKDIQRGHMYLSQGIVAGGRNPIAHAEPDDLRETGVFTEKDCLDLLGLLSHLYKRFDDAIVIGSDEN